MLHLEVKLWIQKNDKSRNYRQIRFYRYSPFNSLKLFPKKFKCIQFERSFFHDSVQLDDFVSKCDVIVHLAALNRHNDQDKIHSTNIELVKKLISACENTNSTPHILFSSSTQEEYNNPYGLSKKGRLLLEEWSEKNNALLTSLLIPNVFVSVRRPVL